ncbi:anti-sigma factor family protein [Planctomycetes bacterium TBK1r]|uniref:Anti-sigma-K factor rskA n=1 Tax=Stieleria magnilauensis TaxID=2527963 RepID=A0ABX5XTR8_9BACT|nr:Anti-sigma-K factor rskA [Planctomycetes bacterium TBK1r]
MDCQQASKLLSNYYDGELSGEQQINVDRHIKGCSDCLEHLTFFDAVSEAIRKLSLAATPKELLWERIATELDETPRSFDQRALPTAPTAVAREQSRWRWTMLSTAAITLIAVGLYWVALTNHQHDEPLQAYLNLFETDPELAQQHLAETYTGRSILPDQAAQLVGYRPRNVDTPPSGFVCDELVVLDMPCCKCIQALWQRKDHTHLAVFEHKCKVNDWFSKDPSIQIECAGIICRVTQIDGQLAASWRVGSRMMTVIGVRDTDELARLIEILS